MTLITRLLASLLIVVGGAVHLQLWLDGYRTIPYVGPMFLVNVAVSGLVAAALLLWGGRRVAAVGMALSVVSLGGLLLSRTVGLAGFMEQGFTTQAFRTVAAELAALVALALVVVCSGKAGSAAGMRTGLARLRPVVALSTPGWRSRPRSR